MNKKKFIGDGNVFSLHFRTESFLRNRHPFSVKAFCLPKTVSYVRYALSFHFFFIALSLQLSFIVHPKEREEEEEDEFRPFKHVTMFISLNLM